ncbi:uncharacterized protein LOC143694432 isoform X2 [Agelaius phoeniceus]|uniref:uncharacterized protein LOC143694432 isoform X2 n=1 Tax=Agelaius phoeniceus TaxID=39638 RepID=UPI0040550226
MYEQQVDWSAVIQSLAAMMRVPQAQLSPAGGIKGKWLAVSSVAFPALQPLWLSQLDHTELVKYFIISLLCTFSSSRVVQRERILPQQYQPRGSPSTSPPASEGQTASPSCPQVEAGCEPSMLFYNILKLYL